MDRKRVANPTEFNISHLHRRPLLPFMSSVPPPPSSYNQMSHANGFVNVYNWGWEIVKWLEAGRKNCFVTYLALADPGELLMMACVENWPDPVYELMTGADYGDSVTPLIAKHWPKTFELFCNGNGMERNPGLMKVRTTSSQWLVDSFFDAQSTPQDLVIPEAQSIQVGKAVAGLVTDLSGFPLNLPGLLPVLGGDDRTTRRLKALARIFGNLGGLGG